jgi:3-deoxy-D-manno-octulosonic-acid transferase
MSERPASGLVAAWRALGPVAAVLAPLLLARRTARGKEDPARRHERCGRASLARPDGALVWIHAASVGETISALPLVERLVGAGTTVLVTSGTVTSAGAVHQYVPLDLSPFVRRFLDHWRPTLAVFVESEIWPTTVAELADRGVPLILVNARLSERSERRWRRLPGLARALFGRIPLALAQSAADAERLHRLGVADVRCFGNLKYDGGPLAADPAELARLRGAIGDRPSWVAASTHPNEEAMVAEAHARAAADLPGLLTVLAPRHPPRADEIRRLLADRGLTVASRSLGENLAPATDVLLFDTIGEMGLVYRAAPVAFVGGSIADKGGQNPIEPALLGVDVLHGPSTRNFADVYAALDAADAAVSISTAEDVAAAVVAAHRDPAARAARVARARAVVGAATGAVERTVAVLAERLAAEVEKGRGG